MDVKTIGNNSIKSLTWGMHDAIKNGVLIRDIPTRLIFVASSTERDALEDLNIGTIVATFGLDHVWQLKPDNTWAVVR